MTTTVRFRWLLALLAFLAPAALSPRTDADEALTDLARPPPEAAETVFRHYV